MNSSCHIWTRHVIYGCAWVMSHMHAPCHIWMCHVTHLNYWLCVVTQMNDSYTYEFVMSHMNSSCHTWMSPSQDTHAQRLDSLKGGDDALDAVSCRSLSAKGLLIVGLFCGKWLVKTRHPLHLRHPVLVAKWMDDSYTRLKQSCYIWLSHVTNVKASCHTYEGVMSCEPREWISHVTWMDESCHMNGWVMSHEWMSHVTWMDESCHMNGWVMSQFIFAREWVMSHVRRSHVMRHHMNEWAWVPLGCHGHDFDFHFCIRGPATQWMDFCFPTAIQYCKAMDGNRIAYGSSNDKIHFHFHTIFMSSHSNQSTGDSQGVSGCNWQPTYFWNSHHQFSKKLCSRRGEHVIFVTVGILKELANSRWTGLVVLESGK